MNLGFARFLLCLLLATFGGGIHVSGEDSEQDRIRVLIETDAGGDPDDEQSLVRFLLYANEWDVAGIIANRPHSRDGENRNPERTGLGVVRRLVKAYGECYPRLVKHDPRYPSPDELLKRIVAGYDNTEEAIELIIGEVNKPDSRPLWYSDWGTDNGAATNNLRRALDRILRERGDEEYAKFKSRLRLSSADKFGDHTTQKKPPFRLWVDTFRPEQEGKRWYHRFSSLTATAGGFDLKRDALMGHGPLGALYPTNTTHVQKEGDSMTFLFLIPTGMNDPERPEWGSWGGRYGRNPAQDGRPYFWSNRQDAWQGKTDRDNTLLRWAADLQNDFRARLDWCVKEPKEANHSPQVRLNGEKSKKILKLTAAAGELLKLTAEGSADPDDQKLSYEWFIYPEAGSYFGTATLTDSSEVACQLSVPSDAAEKTIHVIVAVRDSGDPPLASYRRAIVSVTRRE